MTIRDALSATKFHPAPAALGLLRDLLRAGLAEEPGDEPVLIRAVGSTVPPAALRALLEAGADPDQKRSDGTPALVLAARRGDHAAVDVLLEAGADVDGADGIGRTALMHAVERDEQRVVTVLLLAGADTEVVSHDGMTALRLARGWRRQAIRSRLGERFIDRAKVPIIRTAIGLEPTGVRLTADAESYRLLATVLEVTLDHLGDADWHTRTGWDAVTARGFAARLRAVSLEELEELEATEEEVGTVRAALVEVSHGFTVPPATGLDLTQVADLLEDFKRG
jgi:hypothetical protein